VSTIQDVTPEQLARLIYHYQEALTHDAGTEPTPAHSWDDASQQDRKRMVAAARLTLIELSTTPVINRRRPYYAQPGEADWGC
jgi:hypothetical protein